MLIYLPYMYPSFIFIVMGVCLYGCVCVCMCERERETVIQAGNICSFEKHFDCFLLFVGPGGESAI